jgi:hypothetical protein
MTTVVSPIYRGVPQRIIAVEKAESWSTSSNFAFSFAYNLAEHPLFQVSRLVKLANFIASKDPSKVSRIAMEVNPTGCDWSGRIHQKNPDESNTRDRDTGLMLLIDDAHEDGEYRALLDRIVTELEALTGQSLQQQNTWLDHYIFISPLSSVANCCLEREENYLSQLYKSKNVLLKRSKHSIFISSIYVPEKIQKINLNIFALKATD